MQDYLSETEYFDFNHPDVQAYAQQVLQGETDPVKQAVKLYYAVRDDIAYNPYVFSLDPNTLKASYCLREQVSYCIPKAVLLGALARAVGIPSRLGLADIKNHIASPQLIEYLRSEIFVMHGLTELYLNGKWVKATPAFNLALCEKLDVAALEFDGKTDSVFQEYNLDGSRHIEYVNDHGSFSDVPLWLLQKSVAEAYPHLLEKVSPDNIKNNDMSSHSLEDDLDT